MKKFKICLYIILLCFVVSTAANAELFVRGIDSLGNQLIYDSELDITWYDYTNQSNPWYDQMVWAEALTVDFEGTVYNDWRLPITTCTGWVCEEGEPWHLYHDEGVTAASPAPFYHIQHSYYWTGTLHNENTDIARCFSLFGGKYANGNIVVVNGNITVLPAIAVRDGDVDIPVLSVLVDIKPQSYENPVNIKSKGVLPVAILGTEDLDVTEIDIVSVRLAGVVPVRSSIEDVDEDGLDDLVLKFDTQEIIGTLGEVEDQEELVLQLTGVLSDNTLIVGNDYITVLSKEKG